jgi:hypothetical protein
MPKKARSTTSGKNPSKKTTTVEGSMKKPKRGGAGRKSEAVQGDAVTSSDKLELGKINSDAFTSDAMNLLGRDLVKKISYLQVESISSADGAKAIVAEAMLDLATKQVMSNLSDRSKRCNKPPVCYQVYHDGTASIYYLQSDCRYDGGTPYSGPIPPNSICGGD